MPAGVWTPETVLEAWTDGRWDDLPQRGGVLTPEITRMLHDALDQAEARRLDMRARLEGLRDFAHLLDVCSEHPTPMMATVYRRVVDV